MEENETISGEDAQRILEGKPMRDCYNVQELKLTEDDLSDAEIFKAQYGGAQQQEGKVGDVVPATAEMEEAMSMIYKTGFRHYTIYSKREPQLVPIE